MIATTLTQQNIQLICLPYSGGSNYAFEPLRFYWPKNWKITTVTYPGRGPRIGEPLFSIMDDLLEDTWQQIKGLLNQPYILFGHSLGSTLVYLLAHKALAEGFPLPIHLFLSGTDGPSAPRELEPRYLSSKEEFKKVLNDYGGISKEILNDPEAFDFFEPIIRADLQTVETWNYSEKSVLNIPATVITGTEEDMTKSNIQLWQKEFKTRVNFEKIEGNHFFLFKHPQQFVELLQQYVQETLSKKLNQVFK